MPKMTYHARNEYEIECLQPKLRNLVRFCMWRLGRIGEDALITQGFRTQAEQDKEFDEGDSQVRYPYSFHNHGVAVDLVPVLFSQTKLIWNAKKRFARIASVFVQNGFEWGYGLWGWDMPHMQYRQGKTINDFIRGASIEDDYTPHIREVYEREAKNLRKALERGNIKEKRRKDIIAELDYIAELQAKLV